MTTKQRNILIAIVVALFIFMSISGYKNISDTKKIATYKATIEQQMIAVQKLKRDMLAQHIITDSLKAEVCKRDSVIRTKENQLIDISNKYANVKSKIKILTPEESVSYLKTRLYHIAPSATKYPILVIYEQTQIVMIDTAQTKLINLTFVALDEKTEEADTLRSLIVLYKDEVQCLQAVVSSQEIEQKKCVQAVVTQDEVIKNQSLLVDEKDKVIKKLERKNKHKSRFIAIIGGVAAILGVIAIAK